MKIDVLGLVTRGAAPGERRCDLCGHLGNPLRECRVRYGSPLTRPIQGYWYDLCAQCIERIRVLPALPAQKEKADLAWDRAKQHLRAKS